MNSRKIQWMAIVAAVVLTGMAGWNVFATDDSLNLTSDQHQRLEKVHEMMQGFHNGAGSMEALHEQLMTQFAEGPIDTREVHQVIDDHVEQFRGKAYAVADELIALINDLDEGQREAFMDHLSGGGRGNHGHGHGHGH